jgi:hypothetical protein
VAAAQAVEWACAERATVLHHRQRALLSDLRLLRHQQGQARDRRTRTQLGEQILAVESDLAVLAEEAADWRPQHQAARQRLIEAQGAYRQAQLAAIRHRRATRREG